VAVLVGGQDRGIDYTPLAAGLAERDAPTAAVVLASEAAPRLRAALAGGPEVIDGGDLPESVRKAVAWARPDGVVLLSPAAPSFDRYRDYRDRSAAFAAAVTSLLRE
jgi:UDP-N-acetylmuramoylalanine-D-glutamate ligase